MERIKLVLVLASIGFLTFFAASWISSSQKIVVLDPVRIIPEQISANSEISEKTILKIDSDGVDVLVPGGIDWEPGKDRMELVTGSRIRTDATGRAQVEYPGGSVTRLDHDSEILLETVNTEEANIVVKVIGGRIWSRISKILGRISYETRSTNVVASVRGTEYEHDLTSGVDRVMVAESSVDVSCINGKKRALLRLAEKMDMVCDDSQAEIKEVITSESLDELLKDGESLEKIEIVDEDKLEDDWMKYNDAKEVIKRSRVKQIEEQKSASESSKLLIRERVRGEVDNDSVEINTGDKDDGNTFVNDTEKRVSRWWSRFSEWRSKSGDGEDVAGSIGKLRLRCEDGCEKLVIETEEEFTTKDEARIEILRADGKKVRLDELSQEGKSLRSRINKSDICSGQMFGLEVYYGDGSKVEYGKFDSNDLGCNK